MKFLFTKIALLFCVLICAGCLPRINIEVPKRIFNFDSGSESLNSKEFKVSYENKSPGELELVILDENNNVRKFLVPNAHSGKKFVSVETLVISEDAWLFEAFIDVDGVSSKETLIINFKAETPQARLLSDEIEICDDGPFYISKNSYLICTDEGNYPTSVNLADYEDNHTYLDFRFYYSSTDTFKEDDNFLYLSHLDQVLRINKSDINDYYSYNKSFSSGNASFINGAFVITDSKSPMFQVIYDETISAPDSISGDMPTIPSYGNYRMVKHHLSKVYYLICRDGYYYDDEESITIADLSNFASASSIKLNIDTFECDSIEFLPLKGVMYFKAKSIADNVNSLYKITPSNTFEKVIELALPNFSNTINDNFGNFLRPENKFSYNSYFLNDKYLCFSGKYSERFYPHCIDENHNIIRIVNDSAEFGHTAHNMFHMSGNKLIYLEFEGGVKIKNVDLSQGNTSTNFTSALGLNLKNYWFNLGRADSYLISSRDSKVVGFLNPKARDGEIRIEEQGGETFVYDYDGDWEEGYYEGDYNPKFIAKFNNKYLFQFLYNGARKLYILEKGQVREVDNNRGFHVRDSEGPVTNYLLSKNNFYYTDDTYNFMRFDLETERHHYVDYAAISFTVDNVNETVYYSKNRGLSLHRVLSNFQTETVLDLYTDDYSEEDYSGNGEEFYYLESGFISEFGNVPHLRYYDYENDGYSYVKIFNNDASPFDWYMPEDSGPCYTVSDGPHFICYSDTSRIFYLMNSDGSFYRQIESNYDFTKYGGKNKNNISLVLSDSYDEDDYYLLEFIDLTSPDLDIINFRVPDNFNDMDNVEIILYGKDVYLKHSDYDFVSIYKLNSDLTAPIKIFDYDIYDYEFGSLGTALGTDFVDFDYESDEVRLLAPALRDGNLGMVEYGYNSTLVEVSSYFVKGKDVAYVGLGDIVFFNKINNNLGIKFYSSYVSELELLGVYFNDISLRNITKLDEKSNYLLRVEGVSDYGGKFSIVNSLDLNKTLFDYEETDSDFFAPR